VKDLLAITRYPIKDTCIELQTMSAAYHDFPADPAQRNDLAAIHGLQRSATTNLAIMAIASLIALGLSCYLAHAAFTMSEVAGCGGSGVFDCGHVLHSKWSKALGLPVSVFAIVTHLVFLTSLAATQSTGRLSKFANRLAVLAAIAAATAAAYFVSLQLFVLKHVCWYCMTAHASGVLIAVLAARTLPVSKRQIARLATVALAGVSGLALIQITSKAPARFKIQTYQPTATTDASPETFASPSSLFSAPADEPDESALIFSAPVDDQPPQTSYNQAFQLLRPARQPRRAQLLNATAFLATTTSFVPASNARRVSKRSTPKLVPINGGTIKLKADDWPLLGKPNAKHVFVEMFDYTCKHCRSTNRAIDQAKKTLGDDLAVISLPVPMNRRCNSTIETTNVIHAEACQLAKLAIGVWRVDRAAFAGFHQWLFSQDTAPTFTAAAAEAKRRVDPAALDAELSRNVCDQYLARNVELYKRVGKGAIPKMIFPQTTIVGEFTSGESLTNLIRQYTDNPN
jgi:uncharacterized membrane protein/protein-disulfide isomerase